MDPQYLKEPTASDDEEDDEDLDDLENDLSKNLSETCVNSPIIKTEPLSPGLTPEPQSEFTNNSDVVGEQKSRSGQVRGSKCQGFSPRVSGF